MIDHDLVRAQAAMLGHYFYCFGCGWTGDELLLQVMYDSENNPHDMIQLCPKCREPTEQQ